MQLSYGTQVLWPDHCVWGTKGAELSAALDLPQAQLTIRKGYHPKVDSYSGLQEADRQTKTGLAGYLKERGIGRVFVTGLATDFCVNWTGQDAARAGFETYVVTDACRGIASGTALEAAYAAMEAAGVARITSSEIAG